MMKVTRIIAVMALCLGLGLSGCASSVRGKALQTGKISKEVVDGASAVLRVLIDEKIVECAPLSKPGQLEELKACLGYAAYPDEIDAAVEVARSAQLALYMALATDDNPDAVREAQIDLLAAVAEVVTIVKALRAEE